VSAEVELGHGQDLPHVARRLQAPAADRIVAAMAPQYLYGDSEPFPEQYDFLAAIRAFVTCASRALELEYEADGLERSLGEQAQSNLYNLEALQKFFSGLVDVVSERAARSAAPQAVGPYANRLIEQIEGFADQARASRAKDIDDNQLRVTSAIRDKRAEMRDVLSTYLLGEPLPVESWADALELAGTAPHGQAVLTHPGEIVTSFALDVGRDEKWSRPRRVGDLVTGVNVQVGFKKAFLRSSLMPEHQVLDEFFVSGVELGPDSAEVRLRRKMDHPRDSFAISVEPDHEGTTIVRIARHDDQDVSQTPHTCQGEDAIRIEAFVDVLRTECESLLARRKRLLWAQLDGRDVLETGTVHALFTRIVERLAPMAAEVSRRSPSPHELSLKVERPDGRREELYVRKKELVAMITPLPPEAQVLFQRLAIFAPDSTAGGIPAAAPTPAIPPAAPTPAIPPAAPVPLAQPKRR